MQSSPYLPSSMPNQDDASDSIRTTSIILAREEDLESKLCLVELEHARSLIPAC